MDARGGSAGCNQPDQGLLGQVGSATSSPSCESGCLHLHLLPYLHLRELSADVFGCLDTPSSCPQRQSRPLHDFSVTRLSASIWGWSETGRPVLLTLSTSCQYLFSPSESHFYLTPLRYDGPRHPYSLHQLTPCTSSPDLTLLCTNDQVSCGVM